MKHPLELTIVSQYFYPDFGAEGQLMTDLALGLRKMGCEVTVLCTQPSYAFRDRAPRAEVHHHRRLRLDVRPPVVRVGGDRPLALLVVPRLAPVLAGEHTVVVHPDPAAGQAIVDV